MRFLSYVFMCLLLTSCMFGVSQSSKFYTLSGLSSQVVSEKYTNFVGIKRIQLPKYMDRPQIVTQSKDSTEMVVSEYHRWIESPGVLFGRILTEDLSELLPNAQIKMPQSGAEKFDVIVAVEVTKMNAVLGKQASLTAWYTLTNKAGTVLSRHKFSDVESIGKNYEDLMNGYSILWDRLGKDIAKKLIRH